MGPPDAPLVTGQALARTYSHPSYADPWECVEDYFDVIEYASRNPDAGRQVIGSVLSLPPSRCRSWLDGAVPDPVRALDVASEQGWLDLGFEDRVFRGLNVLTAWIFSGGSINRHYAPYFAVDTAGNRDMLDRAAATVGVDLDFTRSPNEAGRAVELRPVRSASVLGRVLHILGAPVGPKNEATALVLPDYLFRAPTTIRREFAQVYVENRAADRPRKATRSLREERSTRYLRSLAQLLRGLTGESVTVSGKNVIISAAAARRIDSWPTVLADRVRSDVGPQSGGF